MKEIRTFPIMTLAAFQLLSFGIFGALLDSRTMTAAVTLTTAAGGEPNDFNSVRLPYERSINQITCQYQCESTASKYASLNLLFGI